jgi:hypothetical protein
VAAVASTSTSPLRSPDSWPPEPSATSATPPNDTTPASRKRRDRRSSPTPHATSAVKIGSTPMISAAVEAVVDLSA